MMDDAHHDAWIDRGPEAAAWTLAGALLFLTFALPQARAQAAALLAAVASLCGATLALRWWLPARTVNKDLLLGSASILCLSWYLLSLPSGGEPLSYLYLIPLFGAALALQPGLVLAQALLSLLAMAVLRVAALDGAGFWTADLVARFAVFACLSAGLAAAVGALARARSRSRVLADDLARALTITRAIELLARQAERLTPVDGLAERIGAVIAGAVGAERHAIFSCVDGRDRSLRPLSGDNEGFSEEGIAAILDGVSQTDRPRVFSLPAGAREMLAVPLRARQTPIGVLCLQRGRNKGAFLEEESIAIAPLAGFAALLLDAALQCRSQASEREAVERAARLLVGRESKMREMKRRLRGLVEV